MKLEELKKTLKSKLDETEDKRKMYKKLNSPIIKCYYEGRKEVYEEVIELLLRLD